MQKEYELHPLCTLFPRMSGADFEHQEIFASGAFAYVGRTDRHYVTIKPSAIHNGYWDVFVADLASRTSLTTKRPIAGRGVAMVIHQSEVDIDSLMLRATPHYNVNANRLEKHFPPQIVPDGYVYFIQSINGGPVKIGTTGRNFKARFTELQCGNPEPLTFVKTKPGGIKEEKRLHKAFAEYRIRGEWFAPIVLDLVDAS